MIRNLRICVVAICLAWLTSFASEMPDLNGSTAIGVAHCEHGGTTYLCYALEKQGKYYFLLVDKDGALAVYTVTQWQPDYEEDDVTLVWSRANSVRRKGDV